MDTDALARLLQGAAALPHQDRGPRRPWTRHLRFYSKSSVPLNGRLQRMYTASPTLCQDFISKHPACRRSAAVTLTPQRLVETRQTTCTVIRGNLYLLVGRRNAGGTTAVQVSFSHKLAKNPRGTLSAAPAASSRFASARLVSKNFSNACNSPASSHTPPQSGHRSTRIYEQ